MSLGQNMFFLISNMRIIVLPMLIKS